MATSGVDSSDFINGPLADFGRTVSRTPIIKTIDNITGRETLSEGTPVNITAVAERINKDWTFDKEGKIEGGDAMIMVAPTTTLNEQDYVTFDGVTYEVRNILTIMAGDTEMFKIGNLFIKE